MPKQCELSSEDIVAMMEEWVCHARRVQEIKDVLLYSNFFGKAEEYDRLESEVANYDEAIAEIRSIYQDRMLPLVERVCSFLAQHPDEVRRAQEAAVQ